MMSRNGSPPPGADGGASAGMSILGGIGQSNAQRQAGEAAYQNALLRKNMADAQAVQLEQNAGQRKRLRSARPRRRGARAT
jgi:hypothetical protein